MDWVVALLLLYVLLEVNYFIRLLVIVVYSRFAKRTQLLDDGISYGICVPSDLDFMLHMNNARYLREFEFARNLMALTNRLVHVCCKVGGSAVLGATTIRYRRPVRLMQAYRIRTKVVYWEQNNFYLEQSLETLHDNFVRATCFAKVHLLGLTTFSLHQHVANKDLPPSPEPSEDLRHWMECNRISSERLRKDS